jgi:hypothetical protein
LNNASRRMRSSNSLTRRTMCGALLRVPTRPNASQPRGSAVRRVSDTRIPRRLCTWLWRADTLPLTSDSNTQKQTITALISTALVSSALLSHVWGPIILSNAPLSGVMFIICRCVIHPLHLSRSGLHTHGCQVRMFVFATWSKLK